MPNRPGGRAAEASKPRPLSASRHASTSRPAMPSHALEQVRVGAAGFQLLVAALDADDLAPAQVARHARDAVRVDQRRAVDLPEQVGVDLVDELLDRLAD